MPTVEKISIALPQDMVIALRAAVESGEYASASEIVREALRAWKLKRSIENLEIEELRHLIREGMESGAGKSAASVFSHLKKNYRKPSHEDPRMTRNLAPCRARFGGALPANLRKPQSLSETGRSWPRSPSKHSRKIFNIF